MTSPDTNNIDMIFEDYRLSAVVTLPEVAKIWKKSKTAIYFAIHRDEVSARLAVTGGTWLLNYDDCVKRWGEPETPLSDWMVNDGE